MPNALKRLGLLLALAWFACSGSESLEGTVLDPPQPAPSFQLQNHLGRTVSLSDYAGDVVLLTFMYTQCKDICPIIASRLRDAHRLLGDDAKDVAFVVISIDPARDTVLEAYAFSEKWGMLENWDFLVGEEERLRPIWAAYYIDPSPEESAEAQAGGVYDALEHDYDVNHSGPVYLIDRKGAMRAVFTLPMDPGDIAHDLRALLN